MSFFVSCDNKFRLIRELEKSADLLFLRFYAMIMTASEKPVCGFGDDDIDSLYNDFNTPNVADEEIKKLIYHQEYIENRERRMTIVYHDNMVIPSEPEDVQLIALQLALLKLRKLHKEKYEVIIGFYFENYKTIKAYAENYGVSRQAMSKRLHKALNILRPMCFEELEYLEN